MCGIIGATGGEDVLDVLLDGLARLEYRGYDSAGVALELPRPANATSGPADGVPLWRARAASGTTSLDELRKVAHVAPKGALAGIGHTRWATHGRPSEANAHPHLDCTATVAVVHNGIVENCRELAEELIASGHELASETDTEVVAHLIEGELRRSSEPAPDRTSQVGAEGRLAGAMRAVIGRLRGSFALAAIWAGEPGTIVAARRVSPLVIGAAEPAEPADPADPAVAGGSSQVLVASDIPAILGRARRFLLVEDDQVAEIRPGSVAVTSVDGMPVDPPELRVDWDLDAALKGGFEDFMSKELHEQPRALADTLLGRVLPAGTLALDEVRISDDELREVDKVFVVACGSSYHAGLVAKYAIEHWARLPVEIDIASEFRYRDPVLDHRTLVVGVSQSGETLDTIQAVRAARQCGAKVLAVSNVVDSSMARQADGVLYTRAGPEVGVASTKTYLAQLAALDILALYLAQLRGILYPHEVRRLLDDLGEIPSLVEEVLGRSGAVLDVARSQRNTRDFFFLGRHVGYPVALEGALKAKELAYVRAEAYPAGELKHGPIALIEPGTVVVGVATRTRLWEKMMANIAEVRSRGATVVLVANDGDEEAGAMADSVLWVPAANPLLAPLVDVVPLQLFAYHLARLSGYDVDRPRNLAKTVTVE